jgi:hypothetical protein
MCMLAIVLTVVQFTVVRVLRISSIRSEIVVILKCVVHLLIS